MPDKAYSEPVERRTIDPSTQFILSADEGLSVDGVPGVLYPELL